MRQSRAESLLPTAEEVRAEMARDGWSLALEPIRAMVRAVARLQERERAQKIRAEQEQRERKIERCFGIYRGCP